MKGKNFIYYIGTKEIKEKITKALKLIGYELIESKNIDFQNKEVIIYSLNKDLTEHILKLSKTPENLIIISKGSKEYDHICPNIYIYHPLKYHILEYSFSSYFNLYLKESKGMKIYIETDVNDFYQEEESIYVYYLRSDENLPILKDLSDRKFKVEILDLKQIKIPGKYFFFITGTDFEMEWIKKNHGQLENTVIVGYRCEKKIKKELKRLNFSVPMIFIKNFNKRLLN